MMFATRAVEDQKPIEVDSPDQDRASRRQPRGDVRTADDVINYPPVITSARKPLKEARYAAHACSRKGVVTPRPSLPDAGSQ